MQHVYVYPLAHHITRYFEHEIYRNLKILKEGDGSLGADVGTVVQVNLNVWLHDGACTCITEQIQVACMQAWLARSYKT